MSIFLFVIKLSDSMSMSGFRWVKSVATIEKLPELLEEFHNVYTKSLPDGWRESLLAGQEISFKFGQQSRVARLAEASEHHGRHFAPELVLDQLPQPAPGRRLRF